MRLERGDRFLSTEAGGDALHAHDSVDYALIAQWLFMSRLCFSFARDGVFPSAVAAALTSVHPASGVPRVATIWYRFVLRRRPGGWAPRVERH